MPPKTAVICRQSPESAILLGMSGETIEIVACPPPLVTDALLLVLQDIAPEQRPNIAPQLAESRRSAGKAAGAAVDGLWIARCGSQLCGVVWGQGQPGNTAVLWPPQMVDNSGDDIDRATPARLIETAIAALDAAGIGMTQVVLPDRDAAVVPELESAGLRHLADLLYLSWGAATFPNASPTSSKLEFEATSESHRERLVRLVERTYEGTQDCAAMNGMRPIDDVIDGYRSTGRHRPENWLFARADGQDVGVLLLAEHPAARHLELVYMGIVPEARGRGWGLEITKRAQWIVACADADRLVLAVDAANLPALAMYRDAGFVAWDRRSVFVRFAATVPS